ncbi:MAG: HAD family phosphatase [Clostridia bacterium]|nr:HAD family phosphatase [Clostridia bacterium]
MKAVIFDFDGTIADSTYVWKKVDEDFFRARGMAVPRDYVDAISTMSFVNGAVYTKEKYNLPETVEDIMAEWNVHALEEYANNVRLKPYAREYIASIKNRGMKIGLATASSPEFYLPVLEREGIVSWFDAFADGTSGVRNKDFPDIYLLCAEKLGIGPEHCMVYEDIIKGIKSAKAAGMKVTAVYDEGSKSKWPETKACADHFLLSFGEILN